MTVLFGFFSDKFSSPANVKQIQSTSPNISGLQTVNLVSSCDAPIVQQSSTSKSGSSTVLKIPFSVATLSVAVLEKSPVVPSSLPKALTTQHQEKKSKRSSHSRHGSNISSQQSKHSANSRPSACNRSRSPHLKRNNKPRSSPEVHHREKKSKRSSHSSRHRSRSTSRQSKQFIRSRPSARNHSRSPHYEKNKSVKTLPNAYRDVHRLVKDLD